MSHVSIEFKTDILVNQSVIIIILGLRKTGRRYSLEALPKHLQKERISNPSKGAEKMHYLL